MPSFPRFKVRVVSWRLLIVVLVCAISVQGIVVPHAHAAHEETSGQGDDHACRPHFHLGTAFGHSHHGQKHHHHHPRRGKGERSERQAAPDRRGVEDAAVVDAGRVPTSSRESGGGRSCPCGDAEIQVGDPLALPSIQAFRLANQPLAWACWQPSVTIVSPIPTTLADRFWRPPDGEPAVPLYLGKLTLRL